MRKTDEEIATAIQALAMLAEKAKEIPQPIIEAIAGPGVPEEEVEKAKEAARSHFAGMIEGLLSQMTTASEALKWAMGQESKIPLDALIEVHRTVSKTAHPSFMSQNVAL